MNGLTTNKHQPASLYFLFVCVGSSFAVWLARWTVAWLIGLLRSFVHWLIGCMVD
jgi:hypothetical protein